MSNVLLTIGGRNFTVACAEGEESHVKELGGMIDAKLESMGDIAGQSEARILLFAALLLADELHELMREGGNGGGNAGDNAPAIIDGATKLLDSVADRLENLASRLES